MEVQRDNWGLVRLAPIIEYILSSGFSIKGNIITYFSQSENAFVFVGREPLQEEITIPTDDMCGDFSNKLTLRCKPPHGSMSPLNNQENGNKNGGGLIGGNNLVGLSGRGTDTMGKLANPLKFEP